MKLDYGDRKIIATVETMDCGTPQDEGKRSLTLESPILALYDNCDGTREDLLVRSMEYSLLEIERKNEIR